MNSVLTWSAEIARQRMLDASGAVFNQDVRAQKDVAVQLRLAGAGTADRIDVVQVVMICAP
nr:hypothetical protein [Aquamicrobium zhengzhouense]